MHFAQCTSSSCEPSLSLTRVIPFLLMAFFSRKLNKEEKNLVVVFWRNGKAPKKHDIKRQQNHWTRPIYHSFSAFFGSFLSCHHTFISLFIHSHLKKFTLKHANDKLIKETFNTNFSFDGVFSLRCWLSCTPSTLFYSTVHVSLLLLSNPLAHFKWDHFYLFD